MKGYLIFLFFASGFAISDSLFFFLDLIAYISIKLFFLWFVVDGLPGPLQLRGFITYAYYLKCYFNYLLSHWIFILTDSRIWREFLRILYVLFLNEIVNLPSWINSKGIQLDCGVFCCYCQNMSTRYSCKPIFVTTAVELSMN